MVDKSLSDAAWKAFSKGKSYDDAALVKALAALGKVKDTDSDARLKALAAVGDAQAPLRKAAKTDKGLAAQLAEMDKALAKAVKDTEEAAKESDDVSPAQLSTAIPALVRQMRGGDVMHVMVALLGKATAVLISRRAVGPSQRKMLAEHLGGTSGLKVITGDCSIADNTLVFSLQAEAAGLAKRLRAAMLAQAGLRLKVLVRGLDGEDADLEGDDTPAGEPDAQPTAGGGDTTPPGDARFEQAWAVLEPKLQAALQAQHPQAGRLRAVSAFAQEKAEAGQMDAALKALTMLQQLLDAPVGAAVPRPAALEQALAGWRTQRDGIVTSLKALAHEIATSGFDETKAAVVQISAVVKQLTAEPSEPQQVTELMRWLDTDEVVADVDALADDIQIRDPLKLRLTALQQALAA